MTPDSAITTNVQVDTAWRNGMLANPEYWYTTKPRGESFWSELMSRFDRWLSSLINGRYDGVGDILGFAIVLGAIALAIYLVMRSRKQNIFERSAHKVAQVTEIQLEEAHDIDRLIGEAVTSGDLRLAIRLQYRRTLADMRDLNMIVYKPEKTDSEYVSECPSTVRSEFRIAVRMFQCAWYGLEDVGSEDYQRARQAFNAVRQLLSAHA